MHHRNGMGCTKVLAPKAETHLESYNRSKPAIVVQHDTHVAGKDTPQAMIQLEKSKEHPKLIRMGFVLTLTGRT